MQQQISGCNNNKNKGGDLVVAPFDYGAEENKGEESRCQILFWK